MVIEIRNLSFTDSFLTSCSTVTQGTHEWKKTIQVPVWFSTKKKEGRNSLLL